MIIRIAVDAEVGKMPYIDSEGMEKIQVVMASAFKAVALPLVGSFPEEGITVGIHQHYSDYNTNCSDCIELSRDERN